MVLFIIFCPIIAAILIMIGAPARKTALAASGVTLAATLFLLASFQPAQREFQHVTSFSISPEWHLSFTTGLSLDESARSPSSENPRSRANW